MRVDISSRLVSPRGVEPGQAILMLASALVTALSISWVLQFSRYGIDLTDESFYLVSIANPFLYSASATQFGFVYHPLYSLVRGDVAALRQISLLITISLSFVLSYVFLSKEFKGHALGPWVKSSLAAGFATTALTTLVFAGLWLPTPSYNSFALQSMLLAGISLLLAERVLSLASVSGWILLGMAGGLTFLAKPTSALALMVCAGAYLILARKLSALGGLSAVALAAAVVAAFGVLIDGSLSVFVERLRGGAEVGRLLDSGHDIWSIFRLDNFRLGEKGRSFLIYASLVFFAAAFLVQAERMSLRRLGITISLGFALASSLIISNQWVSVLGDGRFFGLLLWSVPYAAVILLAVTCRSDGVRQALRGSWPLMVLFGLLPYAYAFGTSNNYWIPASQASIFWILAGAVLLSQLPSKSRLISIFLSLSLAVQLVVVAIVQTGVNHPYRQPQPLREQSYSIEFGANSSLFISEDFGRYLEAVRGVAVEAAFDAGTPLIDLSGVSPGVAYFLRAKSIGQAWTIGGYPGSNRLAIEMQKRVACTDLASAWLLVEPEGVARISPEILSRFGASWPEDYVLVGEFKTSGGAGEYKHPRRQQLFKPRRALDVATAACLVNRDKST